MSREPDWPSAPIDGPIHRTPVSDFLANTRGDLRPGDLGSRR